MGACAIKLDMDKAYDRVDWLYLQAIMHKLGFTECWINMIMECVESVSLSAIVCGQLSEFFRPSRGLRQGIQSPLICFCSVVMVLVAC
jgi:hypothetical protein